MNHPPLGLVRGMPAAQYHADPGSVSNTMLNAMNDSPAHCYALHLDPNRPERKATAAMQAGTLAHTIILEPHRLARDYVIRPPEIDYRTTAGKAWRDSQSATIVDGDAVDLAERQRDAILRVASLRELLAAGDAEASIFWEDATTGLRCRARPDWLHWHDSRTVSVLDVKTISELTLKAIQSAVGGYGYHRQRAHYCNGLKACGITVREFVFGFVSSSYPVLAAAFVLDEETAQQGADEVAELLDRFAYCQERNEWPAFGDGYQLTGLPAWAKRTNEIELEIIQ